MGEESKNKSCAWCGNFQRYYIKGLRRFEKSEYGYCKQSRQIVCREGSCECWKSAAKGRAVSKRAASRALSEIFSDISALRQIFEEESEEERLP